MDNLPSNFTFILTAIIGGFAMILLPTIVGIMWKSYRDNTRTVQKNTIALVELKTTIELIIKRTDKIPKIEADVNSAHEKIRGLYNEG